MALDTFLRLRKEQLELFDDSLTCPRPCERLSGCAVPGVNMWAPLTPCYVMVGHSLEREAGAASYDISGCRQHGPHAQGHGQVHSSRMPCVQRTVAARGSPVMEKR